MNTREIIIRKFLGDEPEGASLLLRKGHRVAQIEFKIRILLPLPPVFYKHELLCLA